MNQRQLELFDKVKNAQDALYLSENQIGNAGAQAIAEALKANPTLTWLVLRRGQIGAAGARAIAETLNVNMRLTRLMLGRNELGDAGAKAIAAAIKVNSTLKRLDLHANMIGHDGAQAIAEALKVNTTVKRLYLDQNQIGDVGAHAIAEALKANTAVTALHLSENQIGDIGAQEIAEALKMNTTLKWLDLQSNCFSNAGLQAIREASQVNPTLTHLDLDLQINPRVFSLLPRLATAEDLHNVFHLLTCGLALEDQPTSLPALPAEIAELIMDNAHYWQGAQHTKQLWFGDDTPADILEVKLPQSVNANSVRVKAIQVLRDSSTLHGSNVGNGFDLIVRDEQGAVRYECLAKPTFVDSNLQLATIWPANHPILRQMREGWQVQVRARKFYGDVLLESLYVGCF
ncbi:hypothetical protein CAOG_005642 [Capsaspora owczarzaki ATCC 30864]|uniref:NOD3 protein n=1 Tax=Capsaspora owczarzaki (strain ATCC 30864) TaxID=595528 RepID=A0A0D2VUV4_CAPO3|nr:hypothetical protein CAOG_005642 [Capsaspora owczarzaki ATCC 30864]